MSDHIHEIEALVGIIAVIWILRKLPNPAQLLSDAVSTFKNNQQAFLTIAATAIFSSCIGLLFFKSFPSASEKVLLVLIGQVSMKWGDVMAFYFNSSSGSVKKTDAMIDAAKKDGQ